MSVTKSPFLASGSNTASLTVQYEHMLALLAEHSPAMFALFDAESQQALFLNESGRKWLNPTPGSEIGNLSLPDLIGMRSRDKFRNVVISYAQVCGRWSGECDIRDTRGSETPAEIILVYQPVPYVGCRPCYGLAAIPLSGNASANFAYDRELLQSLLETVPDSIYFKDLHGRFLRISNAVAQKDGLSDPSALIGKTDFDRFSADHAQPAYEMEQNIIRSGAPVLNIEEKEVWPNGRVAWVQTSKFPLRNRKGSIVGTFGMSHDITEAKHEEASRKSMEAQLQLAQRLESIGRLAAGIAHEINTPMQFVTDNTRFLSTAFNQLSSLLVTLRELREAAGLLNAPGLEARVQAAAAEERSADLDYLLKEIPSALQQSLEGLNRVARIVRSLKEFSHPQNANCTAVDLNHVIETAVNVSRHEWKYVAEVVMDFDPNLPAIPCVVDEFNQVILNLLVNAAHAIETKQQQQPGGSSHQGKITIRTRTESDWVLVEVEDTGTGIAPEHRQRIFEPFFTTKEVGKGTGQGLTLVHTVMVKHHHGTINITTEVGQGTTFHLRLPLVRPEPAPETTTTLSKS